MHKVFLYHHDNKDGTGVNVFIDLDKYKLSSGEKVNLATAFKLGDILQEEGKNKK